MDVLFNWISNTCYVAGVNMNITVLTDLHSKTKKKKDVNPKS